MAWELLGQIITSYTNVEFPKFETVVGRIQSAVRSLIAVGQLFDQKPAALDYLAPLSDFGTPTAPNTKYVTVVNANVYDDRWIATVNIPAGTTGIYTATLLSLRTRTKAMGFAVGAIEVAATDIDKIVGFKIYSAMNGQNQLMYVNTRNVYQAVEYYRGMIYIPLPNIVVVRPGDEFRIDADLAVYTAGAANTYYIRLVPSVKVVPKALLPYV